MNKMFKIGFLGLGKMGSALCNGILSKDLYRKEDIAFYAPSDKTKIKGINLGINLAKDECDLVNNSRIIILAVEPQKYDVILSKFAHIDFKDKYVISLAPGKSINYLESYLSNAHIVRAMPNTPSMINQGVTTLASKETIDKEITDIFSSIGIYLIVEEAQIDISIPLQGSMPAYIFEFAKSFIEIGEKYGINKEEATDMVLHSIIGSCLLALSSKEDIDILINNVCSPGGATIAGLEKLRENGFYEAIKSCYLACINRSKELSK